MRITILLYLILFGSIFSGLTAQSNLPRDVRKEAAAPEEIVSFSRSTSFSNALLIINDLSKKFTGKVIIGQEIYSGSIGVDINKQHWLTALEMILRQNGLWYETYPDYYRLVPFAQSEPKVSAAVVSHPVGPVGVDLKSREVVISAVFFEANVSKLREAGMSWDFFYGKDVNLNTQNNSANSKTGLLEINLDPKLDFANLTATFKALESSRIGEVITSPQITVKSGEEGRIQVGSDVAVSLQDFSGNTVTQFFSTGSIIRVKPQIITHDSINFIYLELSIERSKSTTSASGGLEIAKSAAETAVLLLDGEETIIGGLFSNEETNTREGIPFLKDLPWWFFGLRYVFGYEAKGVAKQELLILLKAELLPTLEQRFRTKLRRYDQQRLLKDTRFQMQQKMENVKRQSEEK